MSGGKSSSASSSEQTTQQSDVSGLNTGTALQGSDINQAQTLLKGRDIYIDSLQQIPDTVANAFISLIGLANNALTNVSEVTNAGAKIVSDTTQAAISSVADRSETATQPEVALTTKVLPYAIIATIALAIFGAFKK